MCRIFTENVALIRNNDGIYRRYGNVRTYLAPIGFDSRRVVHPVLSEGLDEDDQVILLRPSDNSQQGEDTVSEVENVLTQVVEELKLTIEQLPYSDFVETMLYCVDLIHEAEGELTVTLGGGAREILLPLTVATFSSPKSVDKVLQVGDIDNNVRRIPKLNLQSSVSRAEFSVLSGISQLDAPISISEIAAELGKSKSTISRHVKSLTERGFLATSEDGRKKTVELTDIGRVYLSTNTGFVF